LSHKRNGKPDIYGIGIFGWKLDGLPLKEFIRERIHKRGIQKRRGNWINLSFSGDSSSEWISAVKIKTVLVKSNIFFSIFVLPRESRMAPRNKPAA
jgi:hypothetical protein